MQKKEDSAKCSLVIPIFPKPRSDCGHSPFCSSERAKSLRDKLAQIQDTPSTENHVVCRLPAPPEESKEIILQRIMAALKTSARLLEPEVEEALLKIHLAEVERIVANVETVESRLDYLRQHGRLDRLTRSLSSTNRTGR